MNNIFENVKIITEKNSDPSAKDITIFAWHFEYKGKSYFNCIRDVVYKYKLHHIHPILKKRDMTPKEQIDLFEGMIKCMKKLIK